MDTFLSLGSNLGDKLTNLEKARESLNRAGVTVKKESAVYKTEPVGVTNQNWFYNQVVMARTDLAAGDLLKTVKKIEEVIGRRETFRWGPRIIDIDILLYGDEVINTPDLIIPHCLLTERRFVLKPLADIAAKLAHPVLHKSIKELLNECGDAAIVRPL